MGMFVWMICCVVKGLGVHDDGWASPNNHKKMMGVWCQQVAGNSDNIASQFTKYQSTTRGERLKNLPQDRYLPRLLARVKECSLLTPDILGDQQSAQP